MRRFGVLCVAALCGLPAAAMGHGLLVSVSPCTSSSSCVQTLTGTTRQELGPILTDYGTVHTAVHAVADIGVMAASAESTKDQTAGDGFGEGAEAAGQFTIEDAVITGPGSTVDASLNVRLVGHMGTLIDPAAPGAGLGFSTVTLRVALDSLIVDGTVTIDAASGTTTVDKFGLLEGHGSGEPNHLMFDDTIVTPVATLPVGVPFEIQVTLDGLVSAGGADAGVYSHAIFDHGCGLPQSGPVLNLPAGYTVNADHGMIVDNVFVGGPAQCPADLDFDGDADVFDLLDYLSLWFAGDHHAERTGDVPESIDVFDLLAYLSDWFAGC